MEIEILKKEKNEIEFKIDNLTVAEILRVYLNEDPEIVFVAWKKEHETENPILKIETKSKEPKKLIEEAVKKIISDLDKLEKDFNSLKQ